MTTEWHFWAISWTTSSELFRGSSEQTDWSSIPGFATSSCDLGYLTKTKPEVAQRSSRNNSTYLLGLPGRVNEIMQVRCFALCLADGQAFRWRLSGAGSTAQCQDHGLRSQTGLKTDHQPGDPGIVKHSLSAFFSLLIKVEWEQLPTRWFQGIVGSVCRSTEHSLWHTVGPQQIASGSHGNLGISLHLLTLAS